MSLAGTGSPVSSLPAAGLPGALQRVKQRASDEYFFRQYRDTTAVQAVK